MVTGHVRAITNPTVEKIKTPICESDEEEIMSMRDIYKEMRLRGYQHGGLFQGILSSTLKGTKGRIIWKGDWVAFIDNMLQIQILGMETRGLFVPTAIQKMTIDTAAHLSHMKFGETDKGKFIKIPMQYFKRFFYNMKFQNFR